MNQKAATLISAMFAAISAHATDIISPSGGPFGAGILPFFVPTMHYQQVYGASDFSAIGPAGGFISEIWFGRAGADYGGFPNIQLTLSTTARAVGGLSSIFAENPGTDAQVVHSGPLPFSSSDADPTFTTRITLDQAFYYNPTAGNLLLDIENYHGLEQTPAPPLRTLWTSSSHSVSTAWSYDLGSATADVVGSAGGLLTKFVIEPVPEPSAFAFLALAFAGCATMAAWGRHSSVPSDRMNGGTDGPGQVRRYVVENNVIELGVRKLRDDPLATINRAIAIAAYGGVNLSVTHGGTQVTERRFPQLTIRGNIIRHIDNLSDPSQKPRAMEIWTTENALIERNIIKLDRALPIECIRSRTFPTFKNQTPDGSVILAVDPDTGAKYPDRELTVEQSLEEAMLTSFLK